MSCAATPLPSNPSAEKAQAKLGEPVGVLRPTSSLGKTWKKTLCEARPAR